MDLVVDIGNSRAKCALFEGDELKEFFIFSPNSLNNRPIQRALISSVSAPLEKEIVAALSASKIPYQLLDPSKLKVVLDVEEPQTVGHDRIANVYGALLRFPHNDCIVVDIGTAVTFDFATKEGHYLGGAIYPGVEMSAKGLAQYTDKLPEVIPARPSSALAKTTATHIQSGLYWGLLGAIERIVSELRQTAPNPSDIKVIATGGIADEEFLKDLSDLVDLIDPLLTLQGLHEILKELPNGKP